MVVVRKSKLMMWAICPRFYEQRWLLNRPLINGVEMQFGRAFHKLAKNFFDEVDVERLMGCGTKESVFTILRGFLPEKNAILREWMWNFLQWEAGEWVRLAFMVGPDAAIIYWKPIATELELDLGDSTYTIDRIDRLPVCKALMNIEYKTGKWFMESKMRDELTFYNMGINRSGKFDWPCNYIGYYNPQLNKSWSEEVKYSTVRRVRKWVGDFRQAHEDNYFPCRASRFCRYCSYILDCPCWQNHREVIAA